MIFQYDVVPINGLLYIATSRLLSEKGTPEKSYEFTQSFAEELADENDKLQWAIRENPDYNSETDHIDSRYIIEHNPIVLTLEEKQIKQQNLIKRQLVAELPDIILQNKENPEALAQSLCDRAKQIEVEKAKVVR